MSSHGWAARKVATLVVTPVAMLTVIASFAPGAGAASPVPVPLISSFKASPNSLSDKGGSFTLRAELKYATTCTLSVSPSLPRLPEKRFSCASDSIVRTYSLAKDTGGLVRTYTFHLSVTNKQGTTNAPDVVVTEAAAPPPISFGVGSENLGVVGVEIHSINYEVRVTNNSTSPQNLGTFTIVGDNASDFGVPSNDCAGIVLSPSGGECSFAVDFVPTSTGKRSATLELSDTSWGPSGSNAMLPLSGIGVFSEISITASSSFYSHGNVAFGVQGVETTTTPLYITVKDASATVPLYVSSIGVSGQNYTDFGVGAGNCGSTVIDPGAQCQFTVTFTPTASGLRKDQVDVYGNMSGGVWAIPESGMGQYASLTLDHPAGTPFSAIAFGSTTGNKDFAVTVTNTSKVFLVFGSASAVSGQNAPDFTWAPGSCASAGAELGPAQSCTFTVTFQPLIAKIEDFGTFSLYDNAQSGSQTFSLTGYEASAA